VPEPAGAEAVEDVRAITAIVERWTRAFPAGDAGPLADEYADDAEWINAFGVARRGGAAIAAFLQELFGRGIWAAATFTASPPERSASCARTWPWSTTCRVSAASGRPAARSTRSGGPTTSGS